ncbi:hypothetical protein NC651_039425 [Populus alba x Populus x berolinensis]|nr:hypothetical protein NC651_039425 [Populus alba x Populus x berolinensis]
MECAGNNGNNLSENYKTSFIQGLCKGKHYDICLAGGEIPEWFSHRGEGSSLSFHLPSVSVADGNKLQALLLWVVSTSTNEATDQETPFLQFDMCVATFKNKSTGIELFETMAAVTFDRNSTEHSWIQRISLIGSEESLQGVEELEVNVKISFHDVPKCWVEKCGVHLIIEKNKADSDQEIDIHALGSDDQRLESSLIRELQKWKITSCSKFG